LTRSRRLSSWLALAGIFLLCPQFGEAAAAQPRGPTSADRFKQWLEIVGSHTPGDPGKGAVEVSTWSGTELEAVVVDAKRHARVLAKQNLDEANQLLLRGAALHADIARLIPDDTNRRWEKQQSVYVIKDGRWEGRRFLTIHWQLGRLLLDGVMPVPAANPGVHAWYRESSAELMRIQSLVEALTHLSRGLQMFPKDAVLLFYRGVLHERLASPLLQAGSRSLDDDNRGVSTIGTAHAELTRAERYYRDALVNDPDHADARLRHGRVLGELGHHKEAIADLRRVVDDGASGARLYLAHLFLSRAYEALGEYEAARTSLELAAALYPNAQTPRLALSNIARRMGSRAAAQRELQILAKLPDAERQREDPWWDYYDLL
jgi:tetratricopeptide (TPR) repeat protein